MRKIVPFLLLFLTILGMLDAGFLVYEHIHNVIPPCSVGTWFPDCGKVLQSPYSVVFGVPLSLIGLIHYMLEYLAILAVIIWKKRWARVAVIALTAIGFGASLYFVYLMLFVIGALCKYCLASAFISTFLFLIAQVSFPNDRTWLIAGITGFVYTTFLKPLFFRIDPERMHTSMISLGHTLGEMPFVPSVGSFAFSVSDAQLRQTLASITFQNPVGLAAGFDYEANLTQILAPLGFGFQSIGTITNHSYEGNPRPMLGRLPKSQSLMVNKGFKNLGADATTRKLKGQSFFIPVGISIGRTNSRSLSTHKQSIADIVSAFEKFEASRVAFSYYELNISCPNLFGNISFYPSQHLRQLLKEVQKLRLKKPVFVKMPIEESNTSQRAMLEVIANYSPAGVIYGNLAKNRKNPVLVPSEVAQFPVGNFSGKPTFNRSNELISLAYTHYHKRLTIIGCGGIFSAADAYEKVTRGASLVQLITGMIYQGPQLISQINNGLLDFLERGGFSSLHDAVGTHI